MRGLVRFDHLDIAAGLVEVPAGEDSLAKHVQKRSQEMPYLFESVECRLQPCGAITDGERAHVLPQHQYRGVDILISLCERYPPRQREMTEALGHG